MLLQAGWIHCHHLLLVWLIEHTGCQPYSAHVLSVYRLFVLST